MATATRHTVSRTTYTLELTDGEACTLVDILNAVGGEPTLSRRKYADRVRRALEGVGIDRYICMGDRSGTVNFSNGGVAKI